MSPFFKRQGKGKTIAVEIPEELDRAVEIFCTAHDIKKKDFVAAALTEKLAREGAQFASAAQG